MIKIKYLVFTIFFLKSNNILNMAFSLKDMPPEIIIKIMDNFSLKDIEYHTLKEIYLSIFSKQAISKEKASKAINKFYENLILDSKSIKDVAKKLKAKHNNLSKDFVHYKILDHNYNKILNSFTKLKIEHDMLYNLIKKNLLENRFTLAKQLLKKYINKRDQENIQLKALLKFLKSDLELMIFKKFIFSFSFIRFYFISILISLLTYNKPDIFSNIYGLLVFSFLDIFFDYKYTIYKPYIKNINYIFNNN